MDSQNGFGMGEGMIKLFFEFRCFSWEMGTDGSGALPDASNPH